MLRFTDCFALCGADSSLRISYPMARLWGVLDGRPAEEIVTSLADVGTTADVVETALTRLSEAHAVTIP